MSFGASPGAQLGQEASACLSIKRGIVGGEACELLCQESHCWGYPEHLMGLLSHERKWKFTLRRVEVSARGKCFFY